MKRLYLLLVLALLSGHEAGAADSPRALPDPIPWRNRKQTARLRPILKTETVVEDGRRWELPYFTSGNKSVRVGHDAENKGGSLAGHIAIHVENKTAAHLFWWGDIPGQGFGYPFKDLPRTEPALAVDRDAQRIVYRKPYLDANGQQAVFSYSLCIMNDGRLELTWNSTAVPAALWFSIFDYQGRSLTIDGVSSDDELSQERALTFSREGFTYAPGDPARMFRLKLDGATGSLVERKRGGASGEVESSHIDFQQSMDTPASNRLVIDLCDSPALADDSPPPVGGIDFWRDDAIHVPSSPTRNVFPNPSFEQGLRYWTWMPDGGRHEPGAPRRYYVVPKGLFGRNALRIGSAQQQSAGLMSFPLSLQNGHTYTLSFWAKAEGEPHSFRLSLASAGQHGNFPSWEGLSLQESEYAVDGEWRRFSRTFQADDMGVSLLLASYGDTLIDGIQLEEGDAPTGFSAPPVEGFFTTVRHDNDLATGEDIGAAFAFSGKPSIRARVGVSIENAFRETVHAETLEIALDEKGVLQRGLDIDSEALGEGVFVVRARYHVPGTEPYDEFYRFSIMKPLGNTHPTKNIFGTLRAYSSVDRGSDLAGKYRDWGFGSTSWGHDAGTDQGRVQAELERQYGIANFSHVFTEKEAVRQDSPECRTEFLSVEKVTPAMEQAVEDAAFMHASRYSPERDAVWAFDNEEETGYLIRNGLFDEHFKLVAAMARGVRRAMPDAIILPSNGVAGYNPLRGHDVIDGYLAAAEKYGFRYGAVAVHPYGNIDGGTMGPHDLDAETADLIARMERFGYGPETPIHYTECFNMLDTLIRPWQENGWGDFYRAGRPGYDFGNREFLQAASAARLWLIILKYWPRVASTNIWVTRPFLDMNFAPLLLCKTANTLGTLLPEVSHHADLRYGGGPERGYVYRRADGSGIAAVWTAEHDIENGLKRGPLLRVKTKGTLMEFFDLMGNRRETPRPDTEGYIEIPLTAAPLFITASNPVQLTHALAGGRLMRR